MNYASESITRSPAKRNVRDSQEAADKLFMLRMPEVAGQFYPGKAVELRELLDKIVDKKSKKINCLGCMLPHAGYAYSGLVAAETISRVKVANTCIIIGPNHTGLGGQFSIMKEGSWNLPFGDVKINSNLAEKFIENCGLLEVDNIAHEREHSLEVIVPFLQYLNPKVEIVPIVASVGNLDNYRDIGQRLAAVVKSEGIQKDVLFIASSDMTHYEDDKIVRKKDNLAIEAILELNEEKLLVCLKMNKISMCGFVPVSIMLSYSKSLGAQKAQLIKYETSGDTTGDFSSVVGYAGVIVN